MSNIYEVVRTAIKTKIPQERVVDDQVVKTNREDILNSIPFNVKRAIIKLQNRSVIPPKTVQYLPEDGKKYINRNGEHLFSYFMLPDDYSELDDIRVNERKLDLEFWDNHFNIERIAKMKNKPLYSTPRLNLTNEDDFKNVLVIAPFPKEVNDLIFVEYYFKPTETYIRNLDDTYWNAIITEVERILGIGDPLEASEEAHDVSRKWRGTKNRPHVRLKPRHFGTQRYKQKRENKRIRYISKTPRNKSL